MRIVLEFAQLARRSCQAIRAASIAAGHRVTASSSSATPRTLSRPAAVTAVGASALAVALVAACGGNAAAAGGPASPHCGTRITTDTILNANLLGCAGDGLVIAADGITVNLNGHTIGGDGVPGDVAPDAGVRMEGRHGVTLIDGTIRDFDRGISIEGGNRNHVARLTGSGNSRSAIAVISSSRNVIWANVTHDNHVGIFLSGSDHDRVQGNRSYGNEQGITVQDAADNNDVSANRITGNGDNLIISASSNRITGNVVSHSVACGPDCGGYGISLEAGQNNVIADNSVSRTLRDGIRVSAFDPEQPTSGNVVQGNHVSATMADGVSVATSGDGPVDTTTLSGNIVTGSGGDGIHVNSPATTVTRNRAIHNAHFGIEAVVGVLDGGGNIASGNGTTDQCINIQC